MKSLSIGPIPTHIDAVRFVYGQDSTEQPPFIECEWDIPPLVVGSTHNDIAPDDTHYSPTA